MKQNIPKHQRCPDPKSTHQADPHRTSTITWSIRLPTPQSTQRIGPSQASTPSNLRSSRGFGSSRGVCTCSLVASERRWSDPLSFLSSASESIGGWPDPPRSEDRGSAEDRSKEAFQHRGGRQARLTAHGGFSYRLRDTSWKVNENLEVKFRARLWQGGHEKNHETSLITRLGLVRQVCLSGKI